VESQIESRLVERIEPEIAALAAQGRRSWDPAQIDVNLIASVPAVQDQLAGLDAVARADPDAKLKGVGSVLEAAIQTLPSRYREAALEHFGYADQRTGEPRSKGDREERAAKKLGKSDRWYRGSSRAHFGMKPSEYVIALAACAFCGIADPIAYIAKREGADAEASPNGPQAEPGLASDDSLDGSTAAYTPTGELASLGATMVSREPGHLEVFWSGPNHEVFYAWWLDGHGWTTDSWTDPAAVALTAVSREPGDEVLFGLSPDGRVWYRVWEIGEQGWPAAGETEWFDDGHVVRGPLASASRGPDMIELFAFDIDGKPRHRWTEGGMRWSPWTYW